MNINITLRCDTCGESTNCRIGLSNRDEQPLRFCCQDCGAPIDINLGKKNGGMIGATRVEGIAPFDAETNFVDLHLDFPVSFEKYEMGMTPFMRAADRIGMDEMRIHSMRLDQLNNELGVFPAFSIILQLYAKSKIVPFVQNCKKTFDIVVKSDRPEDINAALYTLIRRIMMPFAYPNEDAESVELFNEVLLAVTEGSKVALDKFVDEVIKTEFLKNLQLDCLEIYPKVLAAELPLRPALFLDFDEDYKNNPIPMRVSAHQFEQYKALFQDISEIISRQFVLIAAMNNLLKRDDHNAFMPEIGKTKSGKDFTPKSIDNFANIEFGKKQEFIDESWYTFREDAVSNHLRNAIAHYKVEYNEMTQIVTCYPRKEGINQDNAEEISFLEFMRKILLAYREMHRMHHLIKCIFYYDYLMRKKAM